jgi:hypothetical protein
MIEAVNAVVANSQVVRASTDHVDVARSLAANPAKVQEAAPLPQAPYISPHIYIDVNYNKAVLQIRDNDTGDVLTQFPSEPTLRARISQSAAKQASIQVEHDNGTEQTTATTSSSSSSGSVGVSSPSLSAASFVSTINATGGSSFSSSSDAPIAAAAFASTVQAASRAPSTVSITA